MKIIILKDGGKNFLKGKTYDIGDRMAKGWIKDGYAKKVTLKEKLKNGKKQQTNNSHND